MPCAAPETTATRPVRSKSLIWFFLGKFSFRRVDGQIITKKTSEKQWADFGGLPDRLAECFESDRKTGLLNEWGGSGFDH
jgi:hypothetical protein